MRNFITVLAFMFCVVLGYFVSMVWVNISEGRDIFANTPLAAYAISDFEAKLVAFISSIRHF